MTIYAFGSSLTSAYWNGAATYYRGLYKSLHALGYRITFAEPDIFDRQRHRDWPTDPPFAHCPVYRSLQELVHQLRLAQSADLIVKHSGVGEHDAFLEAAVLEAAAAAPAGARPRTAFWDVDAPATLAAIEAEPRHPMRQSLPHYDFVFTYGGGPAVVQRYRRLGARACFPIYNGLDPDTHFPAPSQPRWQADLSFLGHRLPDRDHRVRHFFMDAASLCPQHRFLIAGAGWEGVPVPTNVRREDFVAPSEHNSFNASARLVLNINRNAMAQVGFSPPTRIFEAAGAGAAVVSDAWPGISLFFEPGREILLAANLHDVVTQLHEVSPAAAAVLGARARERALAEHCYHHRAQRLHALLHAPTSLADNPPLPGFARPLVNA